MRLIARDGQSLEIRIAGYQFAEMETEEYDSNWLRIEGSVQHPRGSWRFNDPCVLTYEAMGLASWIESLAQNPSLPSEYDFLEPNLSFEAISLEGLPMLRVYFELESRPDWARSNAAGERDLWVEFPLNELDLKAATQQWRSELSAWPQRAAR